MAPSWFITAPAPLKIFLFLGVWLIFWLPVGVPLARRLGWNPRESVTPPQKLPLVASLYTIAPLAVWGVLTIEGSSPATHGFSIQFSIAVGFFFAAIGLGSVFAIEGWLGWIAWKPENLRRALTLSLPIALLAIWIGITEEFIFRGLFLDWLAVDYGYSIAAVLSSVIFALLHLLWERRETLPQLPGLWLLGMVLVLARAIDGGSLSLAWGLHAGWVWGLALLDSAELLAYRDRGSPWLKGFYNNPLAGLAGILCLLGTGFGLFLLPQ
jgi:membrane protease YdiL (CAAX protease family)